MSETALAIISSVRDVEAWGEFAKKSGVLPPNCTQHQAAAIVQTGRELGLAPMQSLRSMCFVNGRLTLAVQLQLALAKAKGVKIIDLKEDDTSCTVTLERNGEKVTCAFNHSDAEKAGLLTKDNWRKYGRQMYRWRAIGDALRLIAPDLVMGLLDPLEALSIDAPAPEVKTVEAEVVDPAATPPAAVETPPPASPTPAAVICDCGYSGGKHTPECYSIRNAPPDKKDMHTLINELHQLAEIARDAGLYPTDGAAVYEWTKYLNKKTNQMQGYKNVASLKHEWQVTSAIEKAQAQLNMKPSSLDEERDDDVL